MSRKIEKIFNRLRKQIQSPDLISRIVSHSYSLNLGEYRKWLVESEVIHSEECTPHKFVSIIKYDEEYYIVLPEAIEDNRAFSRNVITNALSSEMLLRENPGLIAFLWSQLHCYENAYIDEEALAYKIFSQPPGTSLEVADLKEYYTAFEIWKLDATILKVSENYLKKEFWVQTCYSIYGCLLCEYPDMLSLKFNNADVIGEIKTILDIYGDLISIPILKGLTATNWEHCFLEFYRCIERLYGFPVMKSIIEAITSDNDLTIDIDLLVKNNEKIYNVRPNEENALIALLSHTECENQVNDFTTICSITSEENKVRNVAKRIYNRRNSIAHWRHALEDETLEVNEVLVGKLCEIINELYQIYNPYLRNI